MVRRSLVAAVVVIAATLAVAGCGGGKQGGGGGPAASAPLTYVESVRSLSNEYHANWVEGGRMFLRTLGEGGKLEVLTDEGDSQVQLSKVRSQLASGAENVVLNVDPNSPANTRALVREAQEAGAWIVTQWNKPANLHPWDGYDHWIAHISFDGRVTGRQTAEQLFKAMNGRGSIIALQGLLDNVPAQQRFAGLRAALSKAPGIKLLEDRAADWDQEKAFAVTQTLLSKYGDRVDGVWAANDSMALGALEALRARGLAGKVPVVGTDATSEALRAVKQGEMVATASSDAYWQGAVGLRLGQMAAKGELNPTSLPHSQREFYGKTFLITKANVDRFLKPPTAQALARDLRTPFSRATGPIEG